MVISSRFQRFARLSLVGAMILISVWFAHTLSAATPTSQLQQSVRAATFEVVLLKQENDPLTYEKPLPLELIPYVIRSDKYWSIGTAFAIAPNTYVSAGHVLLATINSQFGTPGLRDSSGHVYAINQILKFSAQEDFIVFSVSGAPDAVPLPTSSERKPDDTVFAVGNALGEGVVIRDGLLTSETPEDQDGRWKWLRFSAAASPGNSGGPLLDSQGRVIGVVCAKSANENLNYALPIELVLQGSDKQAQIDVRYSARLPYARESRVVTTKEQFPLPLPIGRFAVTYEKLKEQAVQRDRRQLQTELADTLFPKGKSGKLLASVYDAPLPMFVQQDTTDSWNAISPDKISDQDLPGKGLVSVGSSLGVAVFRLRRPNAASDAAFYSDSRQFMDILLKGLKLPRQVGDQQVRITSLGVAQNESSYRDQYGRIWQVRKWPLGHTDHYVISYALPVPEGYVGMVNFVPSSEQALAQEVMQALAGNIYASYAGTLPQWQAFLQRREQLPGVFDRIKLKVDPKMNVVFETPRITLSLAQDLVETTSQSELVLQMAYMQDGERVGWDVGKVELYKDSLRHTFVAVERHPKPTDESAKELLETWNQMAAHGSSFSGIAGHDDAFKTFWVRYAVAAPTAGTSDAKVNNQVLYDVGFSTDAAVNPSIVEDIGRRLLQGTRVLEN